MVVGGELGGLPAEALGPRLQRRGLHAARAGGSVPRDPQRLHPRGRRAERAGPDVPGRGDGRAGGQRGEARQPGRPGGKGGRDRQRVAGRSLRRLARPRGRAPRHSGCATGCDQRLGQPGPRGARAAHRRLQRRRLPRALHEAGDRRQRLQLPAPLPPRGIRRHRLQVQRLHPGHPPSAALPAGAPGANRHRLQRGRARDPAHAPGEVGLDTRRWCRRCQSSFGSTA